MAVRNPVQSLQQEIDKLGKQIRATSRRPRSEQTGGVERRAVVDLPPNMAGRTNFATDMARPNGGVGSLVYNDNTQWVSVHDYAVFSQTTQAVYEYTVATLPTPPVTLAGTRAFAFATNGRKSGEGVGAGTGVPCYWNSATAQWLRVEDNSVVVA